MRKLRAGWAYQNEQKVLPTISLTPTLIYFACLLALSYPSSAAANVIETIH